MPAHAHLGLLDRLTRWLAESDADPTDDVRPPAWAEPLRAHGDDAAPHVSHPALGLATLGLDADGRLVARCSCPFGTRALRCEHQALLGLRVLDELEGRLPPGPAVRRLQAASEPPSPEELVAQLAAAVAPSRPERSVAPEFVWVLSPAAAAHGLQLGLAVQPLLKSGQPGKPRLLPPAEWEAVLATHGQPADAPLLKLLRQALRFGSLRYLGAAGLAKAAADLDPFDLVETLAGHPRVGWLEEATRVELRVTPPRLAIVEDGADLRLEIEHLAGDRVEVARGLAGVVVFDPRHDVLHAVPIDAERRRRLAKLPKVARVPKAFGPMLVERLATADPGVTIELPPSLAGRELPADARPRLIVEPLPDAAVLTLRVRPFPTGPLCLPGEGEAEVRAFVGGERLLVRRELQAELSEARLASDRLLLPALLMPGGVELSGDPLLELLERLDAPENAALLVDWPADARRPSVASRPQLVRRVQVTKAADWFAVGGTVEVDGEAVGLAKLLAAQREGRKFVEISTGRFARLSRLLERFESLARLTYEERGRTMLSRLAPALAEAVLAGPETEAPPAWRDAVARAKAAQEVDVAVPAALTATLREYQREGYAWLRRLAALGLGGVLADDMGLGKTVQAIAMLAARAGGGPQLVLCPASVEFNWLRELERFAPTLRRVHLRELEREALPATLTAGHVVVASYGLLRSAAGALSAARWTSVVIDEAQAIKNPATETAKAVRALPAEWMVALTGTPVENHLGDLYGLLGTVAPGVFGPWDQFTRVWSIPIEKFGDRERAAALARLVQPLILRRTKAQVLSELPPRTELRVDVVLPPEERALYEAARRDALSLLKESEPEEALAGDRRFRVLAALTKLRQLACAPSLVDPAAPRSSEKLRVLLGRLEEVVEEGHSALVFSSFVKQLELVAEALESRGVPHLVLTGQTPAKDRARLVDAFQRGETNVFLVSLKAGGTGLNLTAADTVFLLDPWWNPASEDQAADRAHRLGQTRPVTIVRLVSKDTVEEQVLALHARKRALVAGLLGEADVAGRLPVDELVELLREHGERGERPPDEWQHRRGRRR